MTIDKRKKYYLVLDTETAEGVEQPLPYDIGWAIMDKQGNIYALHSFAIYEVFCGMKESMQSAYYAEKIPTYWDEIKDTENIRELRSFWTIRKLLLDEMAMFGITEVWAYNMSFDKRALNNDTRYISKSFLRWFFPYGTEFKCIWNFACETILKQKSFFGFVEENNLLSDCGNVRTSAEVAYMYMTDNANFEERHMGIDDVLIECQILSRCLRQNHKADTTPNSACWRKVTKAYNERL